MNNAHVKLNKMLAKHEDSFILKAFPDHNSNVTQIIGFICYQLEHCGIGRKADYQDFVFLHNDFKGFTRQCCGKSSLCGKG